ncbi:MAG: DUF4388 domain-containing protein [bacterium]|nr:DUF4388 domain-containing protein [bacterium]
MALKGDIETFSPVSIFQLLANERKTGNFCISHTEKIANVFIKKGTIVYAMSNRKSARLGNILLDKGLITLKQLEEGLAVGKKQKQALGKVLVDLGYVSINELKKFIRAQVEEILLDQLALGDGHFEYNDSEMDLSGMIAINLDIMNVVMEASRRLDELAMKKGR